MGQWYCLPSYYVTCIAGSLCNHGLYTCDCGRMAAHGHCGVRPGPGTSSRRTTPDRRRRRFAMRHMLDPPPTGCGRSRSSRAVAGPIRPHSTILTRNPSVRVCPMIGYCWRIRFRATSRHEARGHGKRERGVKMAPVAIRQQYLIVMVGAIEPATAVAWQTTSRPRSGVVRRHAASDPGLTPQCPSCALRPRSQALSHNREVHPSLGHCKDDVLGGRSY